jgi:hypothetical protein
MKPFCIAVLFSERWMTLCSLFALFLPLSPALFAQGSQAPALSIVVVEGDGAINNIKQRTSRETIVEVQDQNHRPVAGAAVVFALPSRGASGTFSGGAKSVTLVSDGTGRATMPVLQANKVAGNFQIQVQASSAGRTSSIAISQSNSAAAGAGAAGAAGAGISAKTIGIIAAVAAGGVAAAVGLKKSNKSPTPSGPTTPTGTITSGGVPTFGHFLPIR